MTLDGLYAVATRYVAPLVLVALGWAVVSWLAGVLRYAALTAVAVQAELDRPSPPNPPNPYADPKMPSRF